MCKMAKQKNLRTSSDGFRDSEMAGMSIDRLPIARCERKKMSNCTARHCKPNYLANFVIQSQKDALFTARALGA